MLVVRGLLDRLYRARLQLVAVVAVVIGVGLLAVGRWSANAGSAKWLAAVPVGELGSTLIGAGLLAIVFEFVVRREGEVKLDLRLREALRGEAPAISRAALEGLAVDQATLGEMMSVDALDRLAVNVLSARLGDSGLARDMYADMRAQVLSSGERWRDVSVSVDVTPWQAGPTVGVESMFVATVRWEYRVIPTQSQLRFMCVADAAEYRRVVRDESVTAVWHFAPFGDLRASDRAVFEVVSAYADGVRCSVERQQRDDGQSYMVDMRSHVAAGCEVVVSFTYRVLMHRHGHVIFLDVPRPAKGLKMRFSYDGAGIRRVTVVDYITSATRARIQDTPASVPARSIDVGFDGWVFPRSGAAFIWVLDDEFPPVHTRPTR